MDAKVSRQNSHCGKGRLRGGKALERQTTESVVTEQKTVEQNRYCIFADFLCYHCKSCEQSEEFVAGPSKTTEIFYRFIPS